MKRNLLLGLAAAGVLLGLIRPAIGGHNVLNFACWSGKYQTELRKSLIPSFEAKFHAKVNYIEGNSSENYARVKAQRGNPQIDVLCLDNNVQGPARKEGLFAPLDPKIVTNLSDMREEALIENNEGVGMNVIASGIAYNRAVFAEKGLKPITSWNDLFDPALKGKIVIKPISSGYGLFPLLILAKLNGGSEYNVDPGFEKMRQLAPSILEFQISSATIGQLLLSRAAWITVWGAPENNELNRRGGEMQLVFPKEGTVPQIETISIVKGAPHERLAQEFVNAHLSVEGQWAWLEGLSAAPLSRRVLIDEKVIKLSGYDPAKPPIWINVDFDHIQKMRPAWTERWNKEIERK